MSNNKWERGKMGMEEARVEGHFVWWGCIFFLIGFLIRTINCTCDTDSFALLVGWHLTGWVSNFNISPNPKKTLQTAPSPNINRRCLGFPHLTWAFLFFSLTSRLHKTRKQVKKWEKENNKKRKRKKVSVFMCIMSCTSWSSCSVGNIFFFLGTLSST